jgi:hypothetical protein
MSTMRRRFNGMTVLFALWLSACSAGGDLQVTSVQPPPLLPAHPSVRLIVHPVVADANDIVPIISQAVIGQLNASGRFAQVVAYDAPCDLWLTVEVTKVAKVESFERYLIGPLAGRNRIDVTVRITDPYSGAVLKSYDAEGNSAAEAMFSGEGGMADAVRQLAVQIAYGATI